MEFTLIYITSQILTIGMYGLLALSYYLKSRSKILIANFLGSILIAVALLLLEAYTGAAMALIAIIRNFIFLIDEKKNGKVDKIKSKDVLILVVILLMIVLAAIPTFTSTLSLLPVLATSIFTFSIWQKKKIVYKVLGVPVSILWIVYSIYIATLFGIILEVIVLLFIISSLIQRKSK